FVSDICPFFVVNVQPTAAIYTLSLHDALPICARGRRRRQRDTAVQAPQVPADLRRGHAGVLLGLRLQACPLHPAHAAGAGGRHQDRKSTRLNSSHVAISYAVFCLKKKTSKESI